MKLVRNVFDCLALERSCITFISVQSSDFTKDALNQVTNSHSRWDSVRIDNHVRINAFNGKWQVFLAVSHSTSSFLTMSTGELVSNLRDFNGSHLYLNQSLVLLVGCDHNLVNVTFFRMLERGWPVFVWLSLLLDIGGFCVRLKLIYRWSLSDNDIVTKHLNSWANDAVFVKLVVGTVLPSWSFGRLWNCKSFGGTLWILVSSVKSGSEETSIDGTLVKHNRVFLIVAGVGCNSNNWVAASRKLFKP